jgi:predicted dienelactone hydrolase
MKFWLRNVAIITASIAGWFILSGTGTLKVAPTPPPTAPATQPAAAYQGLAGKYKVQTKLEDWKDATRDRTIPVKLYLPGAAPKPWPVIVYSHGLGGTREASAFACEYWATAGYLVIALQHPGSDDQVWRDSKAPMQDMKLAASGVNLVLRTQDVAFALDELRRRNDEKGDLADACDLKHVGMTGHSFGAATTLALAGHTYTIAGKEMSLAQPSFKSFLPMSSPAVMVGALKKVTAPVLHMTGTTDSSPINDTTPEQRKKIFTELPAGDKYQVVFNGGDHMIYSGRTPRAALRPRDAEFHAAITTLSLAFWDSTLRGDAGAKQWLEKTAPAYLGKLGTWQNK